MIDRRHPSLVLSVALASLLVAPGCGTEPGLEPEGAEEAVVETEAMPDELEERIADLDCGRSVDLDRVYTLHHHVRVGRGRSVHVTEMFTLRAFLRHPR